MTNALTVWWDHAMVGALRINRHGDPSFSYAETWLRRPSARAISVSLPLRAEPFSRRESQPFFEGLLPEESQRIAIAGVLSLWPEGQRPPVAAAIEPAQALADEALVDILNRLPTRCSLAYTLKMPGGRCAFIG